MDLSSMLNDGPAPAKRPAQAETPRDAPAATPSMPHTNGSSSQMSQPSAHSTPPYGGAGGASLSRQSTGLTPLQTPTQQHAGVHYPYPTGQSPAPTYPPGQQQTPYGPYSATTPGTRPPSHGYQYPQPSPSQYQHQHQHQTVQSGAYPAYPNHSHSPTPSSRHSQTPQSVRQSPLSHAPHQQAYASQLPYQRSQPGTPLGPPPLQYQRSSNLPYTDLQSPYHQRNPSGYSNGVVSGSPAQHHPSIGNLVDSPSAHPRPSPHLRRTSDYLAQQDRERSVSVSPKTRVPPRVPSQPGSRSSSQQEIHNSIAGVSARSSEHSHSGPGVAPMADAQGHVPQPLQSVAQTASAPHLPSQSTEVAQQPPSAGQTPYTANVAHPDMPPLSNNPPPQQAIQHEPRRMDMNQLLTPATSIAGVESRNEASSKTAPPVQHPQQRRHQEVSIFMKQSPRPKKPAVAASPPAAQHSVMEDGSGAAETQAIAQASHHQAQTGTPSEAVVKEPAVHEGTPITDSKKRPAESEPASEGPPTKKGKTRKYVARPPWAQLARSNPKFNRATNGSNGAPAKRRPQQPRGHPVPQPTAPPPQQSHQQAPPPVNGHMPQQPPPEALAAGNIDLDRPWLQNPPLDTDLIRARQLFGQWEKSIRWSQPVVDMEKVVADWLYVNLFQLQGFGEDPNIGAIEIEAKIGKLIDKRQDVRIKLPISTATIVEETWLRENARFESQMDENEHKVMNGFLNTAIQESRNNPGRIPMQYKHPKETDTFLPLSNAGYAALPQAFHQRKLQKGQGLKLRTTINNETNQVTARIVKSHVTDMHIYNPNYDYDCRITINLEANLNRPDLAPFENLVETSPSAAADPSQPTFKRDLHNPIPDRRKDRLSYSHLAYSIDLTRVDVRGIAKYELELEVDAQVLRQQIAAINARQPSGYQAVVSGFLDNAMFLMRQRTAAGSGGG
ncbi:hypothetical protein KC363_g3563 [Hortaea werneckii]|uniref:mRNA-capping enzyme subunit beta n=1 Tax=Hortaea werneckii TaxID=91943 RepID=A0A3M7G5F5_HORWE|nr:hypothetical protein KC363_g3563 [Hortaea werneckii]RMY96370.1 hypothetical protein D0861_00222 [Hortaea werneckii]